MVSGRRWRRIDLDNNGWVAVDFQVRYWLSPGRRRAACLRRLSMCSAAGVALGIALGIPVVSVACLGDDTVDVVVRGQQSAQGFGLQWASVRGFADCTMEIALGRRRTRASEAEMRWRLEASMICA
jgi:hypothetical protein